MVLRGFFRVEILFVCRIKIVAYSLFLRVFTVELGMFGVANTEHF